MHTFYRLPHQEREDTTRFLSLLTRIVTDKSSIFNLGRESESSEWSIARAPGRMDVMGGIADYSGSLVLQHPIQEACHAAISKKVSSVKGAGKITIVSRSAEGGSNSRSSTFTAPLSDLFPLLGYAEAHSYFKSNPDSSWAAYIAGCLLVVSKEENLSISFQDFDVSILISSDVPEGKGVSSSAAIEVATMSALCPAFGLVMDGCRLATLCQKVENLVVGAACGIMDQMASALGNENSLLALLCQPATVQGTLNIPSGLAFYGIDSGVRHSVGGSDYTSVRIGAFIGLRLASDKASRPIPYLVDIPPSSWTSKFESCLPSEITGEEFLNRYTHLDPVTTVERSRSYAVRVPATHPVKEHSRVSLFKQLLMGDQSEDQRRLLGELMMQSHESYNDCKLGSSATDRLVEMAREAGAAGLPIYGAKITGGGSGGTVCILASRDEQGRLAVQAIADRYGQEMSIKPKIFHGSSPGAVEFSSFRVKF
jgi:galactokinase